MTRQDPHSAAWFAAMLEVNPAQAMLAAAVVEAAGRADVCSICGDRPAPVYDDLDDPHLPARLCGDCLAIQSTHYGARRRLRRASGRG